MNLEEFKHIIFPHKNKLYRFALQIVGNTVEAEDVVQEVMIKMWNNRGEIKELKSIEAWCMKMTRNLSIDKTRSKHRKVGIIPEGMDYQETSVSPYKQVELNDTVKRMRSFMETLPEIQKNVVQMRDIEGLTYQEIAEALEIPLNQVKVNLFRARKKIKTYLLNHDAYGL